MQRWILLLAVWMAGCAVGPNYTRPKIAVPQSFRAPEPLPADQAASFADLLWFDVFKDDELRTLIRAALASNYDLREAVARVAAARAVAGITRSNQVPTLVASGAVHFNRSSPD